MNLNLEEFIEKALWLFNHPLFRIDTTPVSIYSIVQLIISCLVVIFVTRIFKRFLKNYLLAKLRLDEGHRSTLATIISYSIGALGFVVVLTALGFNLASLVILAGGLGIGIGFGLQDITKDFVSGLTLLIEQKLKVGDFVTFEGTSGFIVEIAMRSTLIRTMDGVFVVVPNSKLVDNRLLNWTYDNRVVRIHIPVGVAYGSDPLLVTETLLKSAYMDASVLYDPQPEVIFKSFGDNALNFELWVWINRAERQPQIISSLNFIIEHNFRLAEIHIPFPQRDLWLRNPEALVAKLSAQGAPGQEAKSSSLQVQSPKPPSLRSLLKQVIYFENFTDYELRRLIEIGFRKRLATADILFRQNDPGDAFYIVLSGRVEVLVEDLNKQLAVLESGQFLGELALMLGIPRTATVRALEPTTVFVINKKGFERLLQANPEFSEAIAQTLEKHREELAIRQKELRELGLVDASEDDKNPVLWMRKRLKKLFSLDNFS